MESVRVRVARHNPETKVSGWSNFRVDLHEKTTVLDCLDHIQREQDPSIAFRYACRVGMCGSCAMVVNGKERWTCRTLVSDLGAKEITLEPLRHMPVIRDLAVDFNPLWQKYKHVKAAFEPKPQASLIRNPKSEIRNRRSLIEPNIQCISCGACYSSCGFVGTDPFYLGPHAMNRAFTLVEDLRDDAREARLKIVDDEHGCWKCHIQQNCTEVCPMDLSPSAGIQHLKRAIIQTRLLNPSRRKFTFAAVGAALAAVAGYMFYERRIWRIAAPVSSVPADDFLRLTLNNKPIFLRRDASGGFLAVSRKCTHQGCIVGWDRANSQFKCPCHLGIFAANGDVVSGAPLRRLETFETRVEAGNVQVLI